MKWTWGSSDERKSPLLEKGWYKGIVADCNDEKDGAPIVTKKGDTMWSLVYEVDADDDVTVKVFDNIVFSAAARNRATFILHRLGFETEEGGEVDIEPTDLVGRSCWLGLYVDVFRGKKRNKVAYSGYRRDEEGPGGLDEIWVPDKKEEKFSKKGDEGEVNMPF